MANADSRPLNVWVVMVESLIRDGLGAGFTQVAQVLYCAEQTDSARKGGFGYYYADKSNARPYACL